MAPWHAEYFELKETGKTSETRSLTFSCPPLSHPSFSPEASHSNQNCISPRSVQKLKVFSPKISHKIYKCHSLPFPSKTLIALYSGKMLHREESGNKQTGLSGFPPSVYYHQIILFCPITFVHGGSFFIETQHKTYTVFPGYLGLQL